MSNTAPEVVSSPKSISNVEPEQKHYMVFKMIIVGETEVGKSCLMNKYTKETYEENYEPTQGVDFGNKVMKIKKEQQDYNEKDVNIDDETKIKLQIWDTAGQESFRSLVNSFYCNSSAVFLVYNIRKRETLDALEQWITDAKQNTSKNAIYILVGAQKDKENERKVTYEEGQQVMKKHGISLFFETSSVTGENIQHAFEESGKLVFMNFMAWKLKSDSSKLISAELERQNAQENQNKKLDEKNDTKNEKKGGNC